MITIRKTACGEEQRVLDFYYALIDDMKNATYPSFSERKKLEAARDVVTTDKQKRRSQRPALLILLCKSSIQNLLYILLGGIIGLSKM